MFNLLKNKLAGFVNKLVGREKAKEETAEPAAGKKEIERGEMKKAGEIEEKEVKPKVVVKEKKKIPAKKEKKETEAKPVVKEKKVVEEKVEIKTEVKSVVKKPKVEEKRIEVKMEEKPSAPEKTKEIEIKKEIDLKFEEEPKHSSIIDIAKGFFGGKKEGKEIEAEEKKGEIDIGRKEKDVEIEIKEARGADEKDFERLEKKALEGKERKMEARVGLGKSVAGFFSPTITVAQEDVQDLLDELELSLLESDVAYDVSLAVTEKLKGRLVGMKVHKGKMQEEIQQVIREVLGEIMTPKEPVDFYRKVEETKKPVKILFVGPNGAGKTTTIAKIASKLQKNGLSVVFAASDTFRAAAIEQLSVHASRLGIEVIKSKYGSDPAAVAFDAIKYANAHNIDAVLIDSAGRQDTNMNLIDEMKKINRVVKPDLKIYVGESIGGNAILEQITTFHDAIGIDGAILTKLDCDAKGGTAISLSYATGVPILFLGVGQEYDDLEKFDANKVAGQVLT
ncbi:MAG: signal recognition particle-docking protein FtsY [Candidatus Micrarchaeota archaeon]